MFSSIYWAGGSVLVEALGLSPRAEVFAPDRGLARGGGEWCPRPRSESGTGGQRCQATSHAGHHDGSMRLPAFLRQGASGGALSSARHNLFVAGRDGRSICPASTR